MRRTRCVIYYEVDVGDLEAHQDAGIGAEMANIIELSAVGPILQCEATKWFGKHKSRLHRR